MKFQRRRQVRREVGRIVPSGVQMKFVGHVPRRQDFVQNCGPRVKRVIILIAAIEVNLQSRQIRRSRQRDRAFPIPVRRVGRAAKYAPEDPGAIGLTALGRRTAKKDRQFLDQRGAVGAYGREELRMPEGQVQRAIPAHRNPGNRPVGAARRCAIALLDERQKLLHQKVFVAFLPVFRVDVETRPPPPAWRSGNPSARLSPACLPPSSIPRSE